MYRYAQTYPVLPGKSDADAKAIADYFYAHPDEYRTVAQGGRRDA